MKAREVIARALFERLVAAPEGSTSQDDADAILAAFAREGLAIVPVEPTEAMLDEAVLATGFHAKALPARDRIERAIRAYIAAARKETDHDNT